MNRKYALAIHGGAGTLLKESMDTETEAKYTKALQVALEAGYNALNEGASALEAIEISIIELEDCPLFNAGKGSVYTHEGKHETEASIMCGKTLQAGAVTGVRNVKNPIVLSHHVLNDKDWVYLSGKGALDFAKENSVELVDEEYFHDPLRYKQWQQALSTNSAYLDHDRKFGTVGAVAIDRDGNLAAGTSTGGLTNKKYGRIGDSSIIGSGTYANNSTCAVSCTGYGEYFIRSVAAYDVSCLMEYKGLSLQQACEEVVHKKLIKIGGEGGLIAIDSKGQIEMSFNSEGMYRASMNSEKNEMAISIFK